MRINFRTFVALAVFLAGSPVQALVVNITYTDAAGEGFNDPVRGAQRRAALEYTLSVWTAQLEGTVPLHLKAEFNPLGGDTTSAVLGRAGSTSSFRDEPEFPQAGTWYPAPLASQLKGASMAPETGADAGFHMRAEFNSDVDGPTVLGSVSFYYGTNGNPGSNAVDFVSVALHEFGHAFGFFDLITNADGSFPQDLPDSYSRNLKRTGAVNKAIADMTNTERLAALTSGEVYWTGAHVKSAGVASPAPFVNANGEVEMYAPSPYKLGSSISHWEQGHSPDLLMEPSLTRVYTNIGVTREAMLDIGWDLAASEGEGEGEEDPCAWDAPCPNFDVEGTAAYATLSEDWLGADLDLTGLVDGWEMALYRKVLCGRTGPLHDGAQCAFVANLETLRAESGYAALGPHENVLAALLAVSSELQEAIAGRFALTGAYQVAVTAGKAAGEPLSPDGDPDGDGLTNGEEYANTLAASLGQADFVTAALNPLLDGTTDASSLPLSQAATQGLLVLIFAGAAALILTRRRVRGIQ